MNGLSFRTKNMILKVHPVTVLQSVYFKWSVFFTMRNTRRFEHKLFLEIENGRLRNVWSEIDWTFAENKIANWRVM